MTKNITDLNPYKDCKKADKTNSHVTTVTLKREDSEFLKKVCPIDGTIQSVLTTLFNIYVRKLRRAEPTGRCDPERARDLLSFFSNTLLNAETDGRHDDGRAEELHTGVETERNKPDSIGEGFDLDVYS
jgi:hypothetical protein